MHATQSMHAVCLCWCKHTSTVLHEQQHLIHLVWSHGDAGLNVANDVFVATQVLLQCPTLRLVTDNTNHKKYTFKVLNPSVIYMYKTQSAKHELETT